MLGRIYPLKYFQQFPPLIELGVTLIPNKHFYISMTVMRYGLQCWDYLGASRYNHLDVPDQCRTFLAEIVDFNLFISHVKIVEK